MQLCPEKARYNRILGLLISILIPGIFMFFILHLRHEMPNVFYILTAIALVTAYNIYFTFTVKYRNRAKILAQPFSGHFKAILSENVSYYNALSAEEQSRFEQKIQIFLSEVRITGIKTEVDDKTRLLVAASAVIPIFGYKEWEYDDLGEVLIYPGAFDRDFNFTEGKRNVLGMVGNGALNDIMILSKPELIQGFLSNQDTQNVGIHEFAHLIDVKDGSFDGVPLNLPHKYMQPWLDLMYKEIDKIKKGDSNLRVYGATNEAEFFAVATEYFFEHPFDLEQDHPELYDMLEVIFHQDPAQRFTLAIKDGLGYGRKKIGRNSKCPCKSGKKYKNCCLRNS